ncbi:hypothetical protein ACQ4PT_024135 [Festuca glaucescens]
MEGALLCAANHALFTPISFLERAALVYPDRHAVMSAAGDAPPRTWRETRDRCFRLAAALFGLGVQRRDVVAVFAHNIPAMYELHFAVPAPSFAHSTRVSTPPWPLTCCSLQRPSAQQPLQRAAQRDGVQAGVPLDGAHVPLQRLVHDVGRGGTNVFLRKVTGAAIFDAICRHGVTHMRGVATVLSMIVNTAPEDRRPLPAGKVSVMTGGAPPPRTVLSGMDELGFLVIHSYGLTETYGPATGRRSARGCPEWDALPAEEQAEIKARQGLQHLGLEVDVKDPATMRSIRLTGRPWGR